MSDVTITAATQIQSKPPHRRNFIWLFAFENKKKEKNFSMWIDLHSSRVQTEVLVTSEDCRNLITCAIIISCKVVTIET